MSTSVFVVFFLASFSGVVEKTLVVAFRNFGGVSTTSRASMTSSCILQLFVSDSKRCIALQLELSLFCKIASTEHCSTFGVGGRLLLSGSECLSTKTASQQGEASEPLTNKVNQEINNF